MGYPILPRVVKIRIFGGLPIFTGKDTYLSRLLYFTAPAYTK
jgi:hypothetical protein